MYTVDLTRRCKLLSFVFHLYKVVRTNLFSDSLTFRNFWPQFRENCGATKQLERELSSASERTITSEKGKTASKSTHKPRRNSCLNYVPHAQADQAWQTKNTNIFAPTAGARSFISSLRGDRGRRDNSKRCQSFISIQRIVFLRGRKFWLLATDAMSRPKFNTGRLRWQLTCL